ncbi:MAG TPA: hypothetical protein VJH03_09280 [Blastocatellia bacterium]|nr:hypothetical protein [Blastocatellia bacterium]
METDSTSRRRFFLLLPAVLSFVSGCRNDEHSPNGASASETERYVTQPTAKTEDEIPPHCEALSIVWATQQEMIKQLEIAYATAEQKKQKENIGTDGRWWFDTAKRQWDVQRPFAPGGFDSTHWFLVKYSIDDQAVANWFVDTRNRKVDIQK